MPPVRLRQKILKTQTHQRLGFQNLPPAVPGSTAEMGLFAIFAIHASLGIALATVTAVAHAAVETDGMVFLRSLRTPW